MDRLAVDEHAHVRPHPVLLVDHAKAHAGEAAVQIGQRLDRVLDRADAVQPMPMATGVILEGLEYCLTNGRVTTVLRPGSADPRTGRVRRERPE